jgi:chemotaxis protein CheZ
MSDDAVRRTAGAVAALLEKEIAFGDRLANLATMIDQARADIAALKPEEVKSDFLPKATDELDAVVQTTAKATNQIMDAVEIVSTVAGQLTGDLEQKLNDAVNSIYEACSFQDITGQRIAKVVMTLKVIENRIDRMVASLRGEQVAGGDDQLPAGWITDQSAQADIDALFGSAESKDTMLHGPASAGQGGQSQADIDALFADQK